MHISQKGLGASLLQGGKPVAYLSTPPTETEQRYAQIEKEMLAIVFLLEKFNQYTFGPRIYVYSDHKPPETILKKPLAVAPQRLQGMMKRLQTYNFDVICEHVKNMHIADMLYRVYLPTAGDYEDREFEQINMASYLPITEARLAEIKRETGADLTLQKLKSAVTQGWPDNRQKLEEEERSFFSVRDELPVQDGLIFEGQRADISQSLRPKIKLRLCSSHMGFDSCLRRAGESVFWPSFSAEIKQMIESFETFRKFKTSPQKEPLAPHEAPTPGWEKIGIVLFELNRKQFLVTVDYYRNFWEIDELPVDTTAATIINNFVRSWELFRGHVLVDSLCSLKVFKRFSRSIPYKAQASLCALRHHGYGCH